MNLKAQAPLWPIAGSRILIGILWLFALRWKLPPDFMPGNGRGLMDWLLLEVQHPAFGFYADFVAGVVIPNFTFFAWIIFLLIIFLKDRSIAAREGGSMPPAVLKLAVSQVIRSWSSMF